MNALRPIDFGYPLTLSRNTDIPRFWMKKWFEWVDRGWLHAPHPTTGLPAVWSLKPEDVHSLVWWSKDYRRFLAHPRREELDAYRQVFCMTITGYPEWEPKVPGLEVQLENFAAMVQTYGADKMQWRYSPVPMDWSRFEEIALAMSDLGITECYYSFLHSGSHMPETRSIEERKEITLQMAARLELLGIGLRGCWDDEQFMDLPNCAPARCVDAAKIGQLYGLEKREYATESKCGCTTSIEVASQKLLPCPHACEYCYASE